MEAISWRTLSVNLSSVVGGNNNQQNSEALSESLIHGKLGLGVKQLFRSASKSDSRRIGLLSWQLQLDAGGPRCPGLSAVI